MPKPKLCECCGQRLPEAPKGQRIADGEMVAWFHHGNTVTAHVGVVVGMIVREHKHRTGPVAHRFYHVRDAVGRILSPPARTVETENPDARRVISDDVVETERNER